MKLAYWCNVTCGSDILFSDFWCPLVVEMESLSRFVTSSAVRPVRVANNPVLMDFIQVAGTRFHMA